MIMSANLDRLLLDSEAFRKKGYAIAYILASAIHFAISNPFRKPPEAIRGILTAFLTSNRLTAVGIPQFPKQFTKVNL